MIALGKRDLVAHLQSCSADVNRSTVQPQLERVYGSTDMVRCHDRFCKQLDTFPETTLADIHAACVQRTATCEADAARFHKDKWKWIGLAAAGFATGLAGMCMLLKEMDSRTPVPWRLVLSVAMMGAGLFGLNKGLHNGEDRIFDTQKKKDDIATFDTHLHRWQQELESNLPGRYSMLTALSATEKRLLATHLLEQAERSECGRVAKVERATDSLKVNGVEIPVRS